MIEVDLSQFRMLFVYVCVSHRLFLLCHVFYVSVSLHSCGSVSPYRTAAVGHRRAASHAVG